MQHIEDAAEAAGDANPSAVAASWGFRSAFGVIQLDADRQKEVAKRFGEYFDKPSKPNAKKIFAAKGLQVESRFWNSAAAWSAYETTVAIIAASEAVQTHRDEHTVDTAISAWTAALEAAKAVPDLAATLVETQAFARMAAGPAKSLFSKFASLGDTVPVQFVDGLVAVLKYVSTARATQAVLESKTASGNDKDVAKEEEALASVGMMVSVAGTFLGSPLVLAGTVLFLGGAVLLNRKVWNACFASIEGLPGPGRGVKLAWTEALEGVEALGGGTPLVDLVKGSQWEAGIKIQIDNLRGTTNDASKIGSGSYWPVSSGDLVMAPLVAGVLRRQYGVPLDFAKELSAY